MSSTASRIFTVDDLLRMRTEGKRYELVRGELREMSPTGFDHGRCTGTFHTLLGEHVRRHDLGYVLAAETGFVLERGADGRLTIRAADIAFVEKSRVPPGADTSRYLEIAPDLIVETLSPGDTALEVEEKIASWLRAGVRIALTVNPSSRSVTVYRPEGLARLQEREQLDLSEVVPGFQCPVSKIFD